MCCDLGSRNAVFTPRAWTVEVKATVSIDDDARAADVMHGRGGCTAFPGRFNTQTSVPHHAREQ